MITYHLIEVMSSEVIEQIQSHTFYDQNNRIVEIHHYSNGEFVSTFKATYDALGNILTEAEYNLDGHALQEVAYIYKNLLLMETNEIFEGAISNRTLYKYDKQSRLIEEKEFINVDILQTLKTYDHSENTMTIQFFDLDGQLVEEEKTFYNKNKNIIKEISKTQTLEGDIEEISLFEYDEKGLLTKLTSHQEDNLVLMEEYMYNQKGQETKSIGFDYEVNEKTVIENKYNEASKLIEKTQHINDKLTYQKNYEYNEKGDVVYEHEYNSFEAPQEEKAVRYEIEYYA